MNTNKSTKSLKSPGRPTNDHQSKAFRSVIEYVENNDNECLKIIDSVKKMFEIC